MKRIITIIISSFLSVLVFASEHKDADNIFDIINLEYKGLEKVKSLYLQGEITKAKEALLTYYRNKDVNHPDINIDSIIVSEADQRIADQGMEHKFYVHEAYQPSYFYGKDINWEYWPVKENELRWQLHRTKWWLPMGKVYQLTKDEKYVKEWIYQYKDWIKKNPPPSKGKISYAANQQVEKIDNAVFAWRPLEVGQRVEDQTMLFLLFLKSPNFKADFLEIFLLNYNRHGEHLINNYSEAGNHLLFEAQRLLYAGSCFPELKEAPKWRKSGIHVLNRELEKQVYQDGVHYELDPSYHLDAIHIFMQAARMAKAKGFEKELPRSYFYTIEKMIDFVMNITFPDYTYPLFSDARLTSKQRLLNDFKKFAGFFPENKEIKYWASDKLVGPPPAHLSKAFKHGGFYTLRNGWDTQSTQMVVKAGPKAFWHNQPDNGTFELFIKGRYFFRDSGSYMYGGDEETLKKRNWFRQTSVHNTLTLNNENIKTTQSKCLLWQTDEDTDILVVENQSYPNLKHRRSIFFVDHKYFVIVDEAMGDATGKVAVHYQMGEGDLIYDHNNLKVATQYKDGNNVAVQVFASQPATMKEEEGWVSYRIREKNKRPAYSVSVDKKNKMSSRFITVIYPTANNEPLPTINAQILTEEKSPSSQKMTLLVTIENKQYKLGYNLDI